MIDIILTFLALVLVLLLHCAERIGSTVARRLERSGSLDASRSGRTGHVLTTAFGLLALLIGFSFGVALNRYDTRRADVVLEANAIGTAHYRASFLPNNSLDLQRSLERYARHRVVYGHAGQASQKQEELASARLRTEIALAGQHIMPVANTPLGASIVVSINEVLDIGVQREANLRAKLPWSLFAILMGLSLAGAGIIGLAYPAGRQLRWGSSLFLYILLTITILVLIDLDRPSGGGITIDQQPMEDLAVNISGS
jgi:hypothetical protein